MKIGITLIIYTALLLLNLQTTNGQLLLRFEEGKATAYSLNGGDEFETSELDRDKWMTAYPWARHLYCSMDVSVYSDGEDLLLKNGQLHITARRAPVTTKAIPYEKDDFLLTCAHKPTVKNLMDFDFQSGLIYSKQQFTYGYYEMNFKADPGEGFWPAFWLFGEDNQEIDIFEIGGTKTSSYHVDVHCKNGCDNYKRFLGIFRSNWGDYLETNTNWSTGFHTAAIDWTNEGISWFIDGTPIAWWKGQFKDPMSIIANLAVTDKEGTFGGKVNEKTKFPSEMTVEFIRVWQPDPRAVLKFRKDYRVPAINNDTVVEVIRKKRPEFKKKVFKNMPDRIFAVLTKSNQLELEVRSVKNSEFSVAIKNSAGKIIISQQLTTGKNKITLKDMPAGQYSVIVNRADIQSMFTLEMP